MEIVLKNNCDKIQLEKLTEWICKLKIVPIFTRENDHTVLGLSGDTSMVDIDMVDALDIVESVKRVG